MRNHHSMCFTSNPRLRCTLIPRPCPLFLCHSFLLSLTSVSTHHSAPHHHHCCRHRSPPATMTARTSPPARPPKTPSAAPSLSSLRKKHVSTSESPAVDLLNRVAGTSNASPQEHSTVVFGGTISGEDSAAPASANQLQPSSHYNYLSASLGHGASTKPLDGISLNSKSSLDSVKTAKDSLRHIISRTPTGNSSKISTGGGTNDSIGRSSGKG